MPNKRKDTKRHVGLWLEPEEIEAIKAAALDRGISVAELIREAVTKYEHQKDTVRPVGEVRVQPPGSSGKG